MTYDLKCSKISLFNQSGLSCFCLYRPRYILHNKMNHTARIDRQTRSCGYRVSLPERKPTGCIRRRPHSKKASPVGTRSSNVRFFMWPKGPSLYSENSTRELHPAPAEPSPCPRFPVVTAHQHQRSDFEVTVVAFQPKA
jgi:hypothetical protein